MKASRNSPVVARRTISDGTGKSASHPSEAEFTRMVLSLAKTLGYRSAHFRPGMNRRGKWQTAVQGDGVGFPDIILLRGERIIAAELKVGKGRATDEQEAWIDAFWKAGAGAYLWRWEDWDSIVETLR